MSLRIATNMSSLIVQNAMSKSQRDTDRAVRNLATGSRLANPGSDVAGAAIADQMKAEISSMGAARRNVGDAVSFVSVAEGSLNEQSNILMRMRELSVQAASDQYSKNERAMMNLEFKEIKAELDRIAKTTTFNSAKLLDGSSKEYDFQVGTKGDQNSRISFKSDANTTASSLDIDGAGVEDKSDAVDAINSLDKAMTKVAQARASFGAVQSRLDSADAVLGSQVENISDARSRIYDADVAKEVSDVRRGQILQQYQSAVLAQTNEQAGMALKLIG